MFNEDNTIEQLIIKTLISNGWDYKSPEHLGRGLSDVLCEGILKEKLIQFNPEIAQDNERADEVIHKLKTIILSAQPHNLVANNETFKKALFENNTYPFGENNRAISVKFFDFDDLSNNSFIVTNQFVFPREEGGKRLDVVLLVNGMPLVVGEVKSPVRNATSWLDAAGDISDYEKSIAQLFVPNVFNFASEGKCFRYGSINMPIELWGPWHTADNKNEGTLADIERSVKNMLTPYKVMDIMLNFTMFATDKKFRKIKIISRYQQYEGANLIVDRVTAGYPKKGLIWHFQGSGKSLLMVFAAQKLRMHTALKNPTVCVVVDRLDLDTQITSTFNASDIPNMIGADSKQDLISFFKHDTRKILITTIFKFGEVDGVLNERENIILLVDEAHRTQEGDLGRKMRTALPNAFLFGLTGTPINKADKNTFWAFGAEEDKQGYMSKYSFSDSIRDNATLPLYFEPVPLELHIDTETINKEFDMLAQDLTDQERSDLAKKVKMEALIKTPDRIEKICEHISEHYLSKVKPNGFKAQVVVYDRECCVLYKNELDRILDPEVSAIVMHTEGDKADKYKEYKLNRDEEAKLLDRFRDPSDPLSILIVTSKLLTGFDAPILQTMYLDKPMKDHTLLQAICRTNRLYSNKTNGLIVDYLGIFDNVAAALGFDDESVLKVIENISLIKEKMQKLMDKCLSYFPNVDRAIEGFEGLMLAQQCLPTNKEKDEFASHYSVLHRAWEALSPDPILDKYKNDYVWLTKVHESVKPISNQGKLVWYALGAKTIELIHQNTTVEAVRDDLETLVINAEVLEELMASKDPKKQAKEIEIKLIARLRKHLNTARFIKLAQRLEDLKEKHEQGLISSVEFLKLLLQLAKDTVEAEKTVSTEEEQEKAKSALTELFNEVKNEKTPVIVERIVNDIDDIVKKVRFPGWQNTNEGERLVKQELRKVMYLKYKIRDEEAYEKAYSYIKMYY